MSQQDAANALVKYVYSGVLGDTIGKGVSYALISATDETFAYLAALEAESDPPSPVTRYQVGVNRQTGELSTPKLIEITDNEMHQAILAATGEKLSSCRRFVDGGLSISYKVTTVQKPDTGYVVQLRHHGHVASMDALMRFVQANSKPGAIPLPLVYSIPGEAARQRDTGFGRQITQLIPGHMAEGVYSQTSHATRLQFVRKMALAWQACWELPLPSPRQIGELIATEDDSKIEINVGPDRHFSLGGPYSSVREWLRLRIQHTVTSLERAYGIDDYKDKYLTSIKTFVGTRLGEIPETVEQCPIVALHVDMGLHNIIVSAEDPTKINAIIDWEFCASAPFLTAYECLDRLFRRGAENGFGAEYPHAQELRDAFWDTIPTWKYHWESQAAKDFMLWFRFAQFLKPSYCPSHWPKEKKMEFWAENIRIVEHMLDMFHCREDMR